MSLWLRFMILMLKIGLAFVPKEEYEQKIKDITPMDQKHENFDLQGWTYEKKESQKLNVTHRYYRYASKKENAPIMLCLHGLNLDGRTFLNLKGLADKYELIAYDMPETTSLYKQKMDDFMLILNDFVDTIASRVEVLCGVSFGGGLVLRLASANKNLNIKQMILVSTTIIGASRDEKKRNNAMAKWITKLPDHKIYWLMEKMIFISGKSKDKTTVEKVQTILRMKHPHYYKQLAGSLENYSAEDDALDCSYPTLFLIGDRDDLYQEQKISLTKKYIPHVDFKVIKGGTHAMMFSRGTEMAGIIRKFCDKTR